MSEMGPLDLSGAEEISFDALPVGSYNATVYEVTDEFTSGEGKTPEGTPMLNVQFRIEDEPYENRRVFRRWVLPPADYPADKQKVMKDMIFTLLVNLGYDKAKLSNGKFKLDPEDMAGRECVVVLGRKEYPKGSGEYQNEVKGVKLAGSKTSGNSEASGLL